MLKSAEKTKIISSHKIHETDSGSPEVQIALLSKEIDKLLLHLKTHPKDFHSKKGLLKMVTSRRKHLKYLKEKNTRRYNSIVKKVGLSKS